MDNLKIYEQVRQVPQNAQKTIAGGRLKGYTDINPMWRIKQLTEVFGVCGVGWYYEITDKRLDTGADGEVAAFVDINLYIKQDGEWSKPIQGTGGSGFINIEKGKLCTNDECFKMALTDAISVSCKALGFGADIYWGGDRTKYDIETDVPQFAVTTISKAQAKRLFGIAKGNKDGLKALIEKYGYSKSTDILKDDYDNICKEAENL